MYNIAIDCRMIGSGGIGSYISALLPFFIQNNKCLLIGRKADLLQYESSQNVSIIDCQINTFSIKELLFFPKNISREINKCNIFYTPYCNIPSGIKIPIYSTIHDVVFLDVPGLAGKVGTIIRKIFYKYAVLKSKKIFTVSNFSKERICKHLETISDSVIVTYNALPHWFSENIKQNIIKEDYILFVGNIKAHKGLHTLLPAFNMALNNGLKSKLYIVGNSDNFRTGDDKIKDELDKLPEGSVVFTGRISDEELKLIYQKAKLFVQPSLYEGFGMPPLEALNLGTNVVLSDIPVFKEIYKDFPVTYFSTGNSKDLCNKIMETFNKDIPASIPDIYSFEKTYNIIISALKEV